MELYQFRVRFYTGDEKEENAIDFFVNSYSFDAAYIAGKALRKAAGIDGNKYRKASIRIFEK